MKKETPYHVTAPYTGMAQADPKLTKKVNRLFASKECDTDGMCSNLDMNFYYSVDERKVKWQEGYNSENSTMSKSLSASLALYRAICLFPSPVVKTNGTDDDRSPWEIHLIHKKSKTPFILTEHKGAFRVKTDFGHHKETPAGFMDDICTLLNVLVSDSCPHPYGNVAGSVA